MTDTIREKIIQSFETGLAAIRISGGYATDGGRLVKRGIKLTDKDQLPGLSLMPFTESNEGIPGRHVLTMRIRVDGLIKFLNINPSAAAEAMLGDIIKRVSDPALTSIHGGYADKVQYAEGGVEDYPDPGQFTIAVFATFEVKYKTNLGNPFTQ